MKIQELKNELQEVHSKFASYVLALTDPEFCSTPQPEKWSAGQQLQHIVLSVGTLNRAIGNPDFMRSIEEMEPQRPPMGFEELSAVYKRVIKKGTQAPARFVPAAIPTDQKAQVAEALRKAVGELCNLLDEYGDRLDAFTLPHPFIGRLSLREMVYFTICHAEHHFSIAKQNIEEL